ncbi:hypothetical protein KEM56_001589 [Ascosphaera pollenicola]|nr:hypothetical protein KEM56_001589 [Ascosphaera pollenicola]
MLRNIPNKIDQMMLKDIVDETSFGKYDFMYLRIDFANNCNVGYAFINFEDPIDIIDFANARAGKTWNCFNSDKVAEISYATIQGKDCLVQKFRNSSVMLEHPSFRPKIFHTGTGPLASTEDVFPPPDNPSKMRRSVENAEHVGLFAPRVGQQFRDEQRRRRSQFDRGTTAAEREIYPLSGGNGNNNNNSSSTMSMNMSMSMSNMSGASTTTKTNGTGSSGNNSSCPWTPQSHHGAPGSSTGPSSSSSGMTFSPHRRVSAMNNGGMASIAEMQVVNGSPTFYGAGDNSGLSMSPTLMSPSAKAMGAGNVSGMNLGQHGSSGGNGLQNVWGDRW